MEFSISESDRLRIRKLARLRIEMDLFDACLSAGIDPDSLELADGKFAWLPEPDQAAYTASAQSRLRGILDIYEKFLTSE